MFYKKFLFMTVIGIWLSNFISASSAQEYIVGAHLPLTGAFARA